MSRKERILSAKAKTALYEQEYKDLIQNSINGTKTYRNNNEFRTLKEENKKRNKNYIYFEMIENGVVPAIKKITSNPDYKDKKIAVLNFANYKNAGGLFLRGLLSQEAALCHSSFLYNVLSANKEYYIKNQRLVNKSLYTDAALYTPNIHFFLLEEDQDVMVDVISCSPPNIAAHLKKQKQYQVWAYDSIIKQRIQFLKDICELNNVEILIAGSWGCGRFEGRMWSINRVFNDTFRKSPCLEKVFFPIPDHNIKDTFELHVINHNKEIDNEIKGIVEVS